LIVIAEVLASEGQPAIWPNEAKNLNDYNARLGLTGIFYSQKMYS
jgi:hypothetical protein